MANEELAKKDSKAEKRNRIRKMDKEYISEAHYNYRKPRLANEDEQQIIDDANARNGSPNRNESPDARDQNRMYLFNYFDQEERDLGNKIKYDRQKDNAREHWKSTMYREMF